LVNTAIKFLKNISFNMVADFSIKISKSLLIIFISKFLGISLMGAFSIALTFLGFGILISNWGFGNLLTREVSRDASQVSKYLSNYGVLRLIFAAITIALIFLLLPLFSYAQETTTVIKIVALSLLPTTIIRLYYSIFIAFEELKYISIISFIGSVFQLGASIITMISGGGLIIVAIIYSVIEYLVLIFSTVLTFRFISNYQFIFDLPFALGQTKKALPFFWIGILVMLDTRTEILILSWFFSERTVGYYTAVNTILGGLTLLSEGVRNSIFPIVTKLQKTSPEKLQQVVSLLGKYLLLITVPISILVFFQGENILLLLFNSQSPLSILMLQTTVWIFISYTLTVVTSSLLMAYNLENKVAIALLISGGLTVALNLILIQVVGPEGVAIVRLLSSFVMFYITYHYLIANAEIRFLPLRTSLFILLSGGIMMGAITIFNPLHDVLTLIIGIILYLLCVFSLRVIQVNDIALWKKIIRNFIN
jgi:O-antigen/teichoic acid export membrane protein